ncbi:MAG: indole-3-glycerol phosphate synthase TrpC [Planctomycetes bacterium]|nr:indole-3-glycerol phosphate synthase TrpC [Planctomycetota bacterium]
MVGTAHPDPTSSSGWLRLSNRTKGPPTLSNILDQIVADKRIEVERQKAALPFEEVMAMASNAPPPRDFKLAATADSSGAIKLIAEIKRKSPSAGLIREPFEPADIALVYQKAGAAAISVLTDEQYFGGRLEYIKEVRDVVDLPVLRKDFVVDRYQIAQARAAHADAILLIAEVLSPKTIYEFANVAGELGLAVLVEAHSEVNLKAVLNAMGTPLPDNVLIGINNRDLTIQQTDIDTTARLAKLLPPSTVLVSESGIHTRDDVVAVQQAGANAILVGEAILAASDMAAKMRELLGTDR